MNTTITYKGSDGRFWRETACARHLPNTLLNIQQTHRVHQTNDVCAVCDVDQRAAEQEARTGVKPVITRIDRDVKAVR